MVDSSAIAAAAAVAVAVAVVVVVAAAAAAIALEVLMLLIGLVLIEGGLALVVVGGAFFLALASVVWRLDDKAFVFAEGSLLGVIVTVVGFAVAGLAVAGLVDVVVDVVVLSAGFVRDGGMAVFLLASKLDVGRLFEAVPFDVGLVVVVVVVVAGLLAIVGLLVAVNLLAVVEGLPPPITVLVRVVVGGFVGVLAATG